MAKKEQTKKSTSKREPVSNFWKKRGAEALDAIIGGQKSGILPSTTQRTDRASRRYR